MQNGEGGDGSRIRHRFVNLGLQFLHNIRTTTKLPEEVRQRGGSGIGTGDPEVIKETMN